MPKYTKEQEKFKIRQFGSISCPLIVRRQILKSYKIAGRTKTQFQLVEITRVNQNFEKDGTIFRENKSENPTQITPLRVEEVRTFLGEKSGSSVR